MIDISYGDWKPTKSNHSSLDRNLFTSNISNLFLLFFLTKKERLLEKLWSESFGHIRQNQVADYFFTAGAFVISSRALWQKERVFMTRDNDKTKRTIGKEEAGHKKIKHFGDKYGRKGSFIQKSGFSRFKGFWCLNMAHV